MRPQREFGNVVFLDHSSVGWERMWEVVASTFGSAVCECPRTHEVWQYMGTAQRPDGSWQHEFRHRNLEGQRVVFTVDAVPRDFEELGGEWVN